MARQQILRDLTGKGLKLNIALRPSPNGHFENITKEPSLLAEAEKEEEDIYLNMREDIDDDSDFEEDFNNQPQVVVVEEMAASAEIEKEEEKVVNLLEIANEDKKEDKTKKVNKKPNNRKFSPTKRKVAAGFQ